MIKVLLAIDDAAVAGIVGASLATEGFLTTHVRTLHDAQLSVRTEQPDIVVLDWRLPEASGAELCLLLYEEFGTCPVPILMLTEHDQKRDRVCCMLSGAHVCISKPYSISDLASRLRASRGSARVECIDDTLRVADIAMDRGTRTVVRGLHKVQLGPTEFRLLEKFMERRGRILSRAQIIDAILGWPRARFRTHG